MIKRYVLQKESHVYFPNGTGSPFTYSDGDSVENKIFDIIKNTSDLRVGSSELNNHITDWPSKYHLSAMRVDLLRPLSDLLKGSILEIGAGCGAITRYLGETANTVVALEGSSRRAAITSARCRDLDNVKVYADNFNDFEIDLKFDVVTLIGVLEYSQQYGTTKDPVQYLLERAQSYLKPDGVLIVAIENQLGLKYFAGAPEDHLGKKYVGVEGLYTQKGPITFGKRVLKQRLESAGFSQMDFLYPFPDYKFPSVIITEKGSGDKNINVSDMLRSRLKYFQDAPYTSAFNEEKAIKAIAQNGLLGDLSNSFLIVAGKKAEKNLDTQVLAYAYSNQRRKEFCKQNRFVLKNHEYWVKKELIYSESINKVDLVKQVVQDEKYISGNLFINQLQTVLEAKEWSLQDVFNCTKPWMQFLNSKSKKNDEDGMPLLDGKYFDAAPFNTLVSITDGRFDLIDLEWEITQLLRLDYIIFRSLYYSFTNISTISRSSHVTYSKLADISFEIIKLYFKDYNQNSFSDFIPLETAILRQILGTEPKGTFEGEIVYDTDETINNQHSTTQSDFTSIKPIENTRVQVYWASPDEVFSEDKSSQQMIQLDEHRKTFIFNLNSREEFIAFLRFDIGCHVGFLNIHDIKVKTDNNPQVWNWNSKDVIVKNDCLLIENDHYLKDTTIQLSTSDDPYFQIRLPNAIDVGNYANLTVEISLSSLSNEQLNMLNNKILTPLSFVFNTELLALNLTRDKLEMENNRLVEKADLLANTISSLDNENKTLKSVIVKNDELQRGHTQDKQNLMTELASKTSVIDKLFSEKEEVTKQLAGQVNLINERNAKIVEANDTIEKLQNKIVVEETLKKAIVQERENIHEEKNKSDRMLTELLEQKAKLTHSINEQQEMIKAMRQKEQDLMMEKEITSKEMTAKNVELVIQKEGLTKDLEAKNVELGRLVTLVKENEKMFQVLNESIKKLEIVNAAFIEKYENQSWMKIAQDRIFKRK